MAKVVSIINQKGGVGKTTTAVSLASAVGAKGHKVLLADIDPQGNSTSGFGISKRNIGFSSYEGLVKDIIANDAGVKTQVKNVDILPASLNLAGAEVELIDLEKRETRLKIAVAQLYDKYDYIFFDCPPSLGLITINALTASDTF